MISPEDVRQRLNVSGASEEELVDAAMTVSPGVQTTGNDQVLALASSPEAVLHRRQSERVASRFVAGQRPEVKTFQTWTADGVAVVDLFAETFGQKKIGLSVQHAGQPIEETETTLNFATRARFAYIHRLFLLPGEYSLLIDVDGLKSPYPLTVTAHGSSSEILIGKSFPLAPSSREPFQYAGVQILPDGEPNAAVLEATIGERVQWRVLKQGVVENHTASDGMGSFHVLNNSQLKTGMRIEADAGGRTVRAEVETLPPAAVLVSYNANLSENAEWSTIGRQHLLSGDLERARMALERLPRTAENLAWLAKTYALQDNLDRSRELLNIALKLDPQNFEALSTMGFVEARLQDYPIAERFYARALEIRKEPALEQALNQVRALVAQSRTK